MKKNWKMIVIVAVVVVVGLSAAAVAYGATKVKNPFRGRAACGQLMSNPKAVAAMQALRASIARRCRRGTTSWQQTPTTPTRRSALKTLRQEHWNDMKALFKEFGIEGAQRAPGRGLR